MPTAPDLDGDRAGCCSADRSSARCQRNDLSIAWNTADFVHRHRRLAQELVRCKTQQWTFAIGFFVDPVLGNTYHQSM